MGAGRGRPASGTETASCPLSGPQHQRLSPAIHTPVDPSSALPHPLRQGRGLPRRVMTALSGAMLDFGAKSPSYQAPGPLTFSSCLASGSWLTADTQNYHRSSELMGPLALSHTDLANTRHIGHRRPSLEPWQSLPMDQTKPVVFSTQGSGEPLPSSGAGLESQSYLPPQIHSSLASIHEAK